MAAGRRVGGGGGGGGGEREGDDSVRESWRDMLVSMPPLREVRIKHAKRRSVVRVLTVREGMDGVTLGDLFEALEEWAARLEAGEK